MPVEVTVDNVSSQKNCPAEKYFQEWVETALTVAGAAVDNSAIDIRVVDEAEIQALNARYRQKDAPTNVLSFPFEPPADVPNNFLGDVIICAAVVEREAKAQGKTLDFHWAHMVVHATLHLLGFDHQTEAQAEQMEALECVILNRLGFPDPYRWPIEEHETDD
ncbi:MAG: rRNA maturation RNase YbeY [Gammaproteobacteria bacterium]|nr:MAG: rRNA maturation RNase YbeY [Gammaproteobacteria bacterium]